MNNKFSYKTILIVDDETDLRELLAAALELQGFKTLQAESGDQGYLMLQTKAVDLVISDIRMPGGDGVSLLKKAKELDDELPVILITGFADITGEEARRSGATALLSKPFNLRDILQYVFGAFEKVQKELNAVAQ